MFEFSFDQAFYAVIIIASVLYVSYSLISGYAFRSLWWLAEDIRQIKSLRDYLKKIERFHRAERPLDYWLGIAGAFILIGLAGYGLFRA